MISGIRSTITAAVVLASLTISGCATKPAESQQPADRLAAAGFQTLLEGAGPLGVTVFGKQDKSSSSQITVYIDGSFQNTSNRPIGMGMALQDPSKTTVYLAIPCQLADQEKCASWITPKALKSAQIALDGIREVTGATSFKLVGYSDGGAVATALAETRSDVATLITVAGILDMQTWVSEAGIGADPSELIFPEMQAHKLKELPQAHLLGGADEAVPLSIYTAFTAQVGSTEIPNLVIAEYNHDCCWVQGWPELLEQATSLAEAFDQSDDQVKELLTVVAADKSEEDQGNAVVKLKELADRGNMQSAELLGRWYFSGKGLFEKDTAQAAKYLITAANQGSPKAAADLAVMYSAGGAENLQAAVMWAAVAEHLGRGSIEAEMAQQVVLLMSEGKDVTPGREAAEQWLSSRGSLQ